MENYKTLPLTQGHSAIVDADVYEYLMQWRWFAHNNRGRVYGKRRFRKTTLCIHREILKWHGHKLGKRQVDHINGNTLDNRLENLRIATQSQNQMNRGVYRKSKSGYKGVSQNSKSSWQAIITKKGRTYHLGSFSSPEQAARAYDKAAKRLHGEFARFNFPDEIKLN